MSLDEDEPEPILTPSMPLVEAEESGRSDVQVAKAIRNLRHRSGLSQGQLAIRMGVPRTYVSKIENEKAIPTLSALARLAQALEVSLHDLLRECGPSRENEIRELLADPFVAELAELTSKLNAMQLFSVLTQVRDMVLHPQRGAPATTLSKGGYANAQVIEYAQVLAHAVEIFGSRIRANAWLNRPSRIFNNQSPLQVLTQDPAAVEEELVRIDEGIFY